MRRRGKLTVGGLSTAGAGASVALISGVEVQQVAVELWGGVQVSTWDAVCVVCGIEKAGCLLSVSFETTLPSMLTTCVTLLSETVTIARHRC